MDRCYEERKTHTHQIRQRERDDGLMGDIRSIAGMGELFVVYVEQTRGCLSMKRMN